MLVVTKNSTYRVVPEGHRFYVEKIAETRPNPNGIDIGWSYTFTTLNVAIGERARFGTFVTTEVLEVKAGS